MKRRSLAGISHVVEILHGGRFIHQQLARDRGEKPIVYGISSPLLVSKDLAPGTIEAEIVCCGGSRGTFDSHDTYSQLDVVACNGVSFVASSPDFQQGANALPERPRKIHGNLLKQSDLNSMASRILRAA